MIPKDNKFNKLYELLLSEKTKQRSEFFIITIAIASFIIHLLVIGLCHYDLIPFEVNKELLNNPIAAIYTPFSFILLYKLARYFCSFVFE